METFNLLGVAETEKEPAKIYFLCNLQKTIVIVFATGRIQILDPELEADELRQVLMVHDNFNIFYQNVNQLSVSGIEVNQKEK